MHPQSTRVPCTCQQCNASFTVPPAWLRKGGGKYCSRSCKYAAALGVRTGTDRYTSRGYVYLYRPEHPGANVRGYVAEHRLVAEAMLGRPLLPTEIVHHRNGDHGDNRSDNLEVMTQSEHARRHRGRRFFVA